MNTIPALHDVIRWHQAGDLERAQTAYLQHVQQDPNNPDVHHLLAILYGQRQQYQQALPHLEKALQLNPNNPTYHNSMGNIQKKCQHPDLAMQHYQHALTLDPNSLGACTNIASLFFTQGKLVQACEYYQRALSIDANFIDALYNLALIQMQSHNHSDAQHNLEHCIELDPQHYLALAHLGKIALQNQHYSRAQEFLQRSIDHFPDQAEAQVNLGSSKVKLGELDQALPHFQYALKLDPKHFEAHYNLGCTYLNLHQPKKALEHFLQLLNKNPTPEVYYNIGVIYLYQDHHSEAISYLQHAVQLDSHYVDALINLGVTYLKLQKIDKAIEYFQKAQTLQPDNEEVHYILSALQGDQSTTRAPEQYVRHLFDQYAPHYEAHLTKVLAYDTPKQLLTVVKSALAEQFNDLVIIDAGCGTGLTGEVFKPYAKRLVGIDLSPKMIEAATKKNIYDDLHIADIHVTLGNEQNIDMVVAGDVLSYLGDLNQTFEVVHRALKSGGTFAFSIERHPDDRIDYQLQLSARFLHSKHYINQLCEQYGFTITQEALVTLRRQHNQPVQGWLIVAKSY